MNKKKVYSVGLYIGEELMVEFYDYDEALEVAKLMYDETGIVHEIKFVKK